MPKPDDERPIEYDAFGAPISNPAPEPTPEPEPTRWEKFKEWVRGIWDGIRSALGKPKKRFGLLGIEGPASRWPWVVPVLCVGTVALIVLAFADAAASR